MHPFRLYLDRIGESQGWAVREAERIGEKLSQSRLSEILNCKGDPSLDALRLLERISGGKVTAHKMARWHLEQSMVPDVGTDSTHATPADTGSDGEAT